MKRPGLRRRLIAVGGLAGCLGAACLLPAGSARADASVYYEAFAKAVGAGFTLSNPTIPLGFVFEGIGPEADARQTSLQQADANAAVPYLGDVVPGLPGTAAGILKLPLPSYPLIASTNYGEDPVEINSPGVSMSAASTDSSTTARSALGSPGSGASAYARIGRTVDGVVTSVSGSDLSAVELGSQLVLSGVRSEATTSVDQNGELTRSSSLSIGHISAPALALALPPSTPGMPNPLGGQTVASPDLGFVNGSFTITLPFAGKTQTFAVPTQPVIDAFKAQGITLTYQSQQVLKTGVIAPVLSFGYTFPEPPPNQYFGGATPVTVSVGHSLSTVDMRVAGTSTGTGAGSGAVGTGVDPAAVEPGSIPSGDTAPVDNGAVADGIADQFPLPVPGAAPAAVPMANDRVLLTGGGATAGADMSGIYLVLILGGLLALLVTTVLRLMGVRFRWGS